MLVDASHDAAFFSRGKRLALEAVDAVVETPLDEVGIHLAPEHQRVASFWAGDPWRIRRSLRTEGVLTFMNSFICFFSMRFCSSRCSDCVRLARD